MGKTILTARQLDFLELAQSEPSIVKNYYLTGGTALAVFYYQHRLSEDIDLFIEKKEVDPKVLETFLEKISPRLNIVSRKRAQMLGLVSYTLVFKDSTSLKVDFNYYPFPRIEKGVRFKNLE